MGMQNLRAAIIAADKEFKHAITVVVKEEVRVISAKEQGIKVAIYALEEECKGILPAVTVGGLEP